MIIIIILMAILSVSGSRQFVGNMEKIVMKNMKRADRRQRTEKIKNRRVKSADLIWGWFKNNIWDEQKAACKKGECRSRSPFDCGRSKCYVCHPEKYTGEKTHQQSAADISYNEQLNELDDLSNK